MMRNSRGPWLATIGVIVMVAAASVYGCRRGMPCRYSYYQDAVAPLRALGVVETYRNPPPALVDKYPSFVYTYFGLPARLALAWRGDGQAAALLALAREHGQNAWPVQSDPQLWVALEPYRDALSDMLVAGRLASALAVVVLTWFGALLARRLYGAVAMPIAAALLGLHPYVVYYGHTTNAEAPYLAFWMMSLYFVVRMLERPGLGAAVTAGACAALAAGVKDQIVAFYAFLPLAVLWLDRRRQGGTAQLSLAKIVAASLTFIACYAVASNWIFDFDAWLRHCRFGLSGNVLEQYDMVAGQPPWRGRLLLVVYFATYIVRSAGLAGGLLMLAALWHGVRRGRRELILLVVPSLLYVFAFAFRIHSIYPRYLLPFLLALLVVAAGVIAGLLAAPGRRRVAGALGLLLVALVGWRGITVNRLWRDDPRVRAAMWMEANLPAGMKVLADSNHATPPPQIPVRCPQRWTSARDLAATLDEFDPQLLIRVQSTNLRTVVIPQHPDLKAMVEGSPLPVVATFGRTVDHPILDDIDALPIVVIYARR